MAKNLSAFEKAFAAFASLFKAIPDHELRKNLDDMADKIDVPVHGDQWTGDPSHGNRMRGVNTGAPEKASGDGASAMTQRYSPDTSQEGLAAAYQRFAEELASTSKRIEATEKAISSIAGLIAQACGKSFPEDEVEKDERGDEGGDTEEDESAASKGLLNVGPVPNLMRLLSGVSKTSGKVGLVQPPNLAVVKAYVSEADRFAALAEQSYDAGNAADGLRFQQLAIRHRAVSAGVNVDQRLLYNASLDPVPHYVGVAGAQR